MGNSTVPLRSRLLTEWLGARLAQGSVAHLFVHCKVQLSPQLEDTMMAARFLLRRAAPALRQVRSYAEAAAGAPQMSFTFASPNEVQTLRLPRPNLTLHTAGVDYIHIII